MISWVESIGTLGVTCKINDLEITFGDWWV